MAAWNKDELARIGSTDELEIRSLRSDGTLGKPVTIWVVSHGGDLYIRSVKGPTAAWFRGTKVRNEGRIRAGGVEKDVTFVDPDDDVADALDAAYRDKYRRYGESLVDPILS